MNKYELISMAKEAMEFTDNFIEETKHYECEEVLVYLPDMLQDIVNDVDGFFEKSFCETEGANFFVVDADFFDAALDLEKPLVMNFASAHRPGGGFLNGAKAQEESLCRCSTLYKSISGDKVKEMYNYNNSGKNPCTSDYMLLSQNVYVFMDLRGDMLDVPFWASVVTVPAPNKRGAASNVPQDVLAHVMTERLKKMLFLAVRKGYKNLVLGAWGCGAFGNDTRRILIWRKMKFRKTFNYSR